MFTGKNIAFLQLNLLSSSGYWASKMGLVHSLSQLLLGNPMREQGRETKMKKDAGSNTTGGGKGRSRRRCKFSVIIYR